MKTIKQLLTALGLLSGLVVASNATAATNYWSPGIIDMNWSDTNNWFSVPVPATGDSVIISNNAGAFALPVSFTNSIVDPGFTNTLGNLWFSMRDTNSLFSMAITAPSGLNISSTNATGLAPLMCGDGLDDKTGNGASATHLYTAISGTSLSVSNTNHIVLIRDGGQTNYTSANQAVLDLTNLNTFTLNVSYLGIGFQSVPTTTQWGGTSYGDNRPSGSVFLAQTNYITCVAPTAINSTPCPGAGYYLACVNASASSEPCTNLLGQVNYFNVNGMEIGGAKYSKGAYFMFNPIFKGPTAMVTFRASDGVSRQDSWIIGDEYTTNTYAYINATMDLTGGTVDALVNTIIVGRGAYGNYASLAQANANYGEGNLSFGQGTIDVNTMEIGYSRIPGPMWGWGFVNVYSNAILKINTSLRMGEYLGNGGITTVTHPSAGTLNVNGGTVNLYGPILDGGGTNTLIIANSGTVNGMPAGSTVAQNISVGTVNLNDGTGNITNYALLATTNVLAPYGFTVYAGEGLSAAAIGTIGQVNFNNSAAFTNANLYFDIAGPGTNDTFNIQGGPTVSGTNTIVINALPGFGPGSYTLMTDYGITGDNTNFKISGNSPYVCYVDPGSLPNIVLVVTSVPSSPPTLSLTNAATNMALSWSGIYTNYTLQGQTNAYGVGITTNWYPVSGVVSNSVTLPVIKTNGSVFYRLVN